MKYLAFLAVSYVTALFFEYIASTVGDGTLFQSDNWGVFFLIWYWLIYSILYVLFRNRRLWWGIVFFAIFGSLAEVLIFQRTNPFVDPIIYALMALIPLWVHKKWII